MKTPLRVLIVEDSEFDARILVNVLRKGGYEPAFERVETGEAMRQAMSEQKWDVILADYNLPMFSAPEALRILQESNLDLPFLIVSGGIGEDIAVASMKAGAHDYLMKGNLARLVPAVERELREAGIRAARRQAEEAVRESELRYRLLWETATDAVLLMDTESNIQFANPAVEIVFGYPPDEVVGKNLTLLLPERLNPREQVEHMRVLHSGVRESAPHMLETVGVRKNGHEVLIEIVFNEMGLHGKRWFVAFVRDITERKRAEEELRLNEQQFRVAHEIQQRLFPKSAPQIPGFEIAGVSYPAEAAGGDYFDYLHLLHDRFGVVVADVTGHGVGPALLMAETRAYLRLLALNRDDMGEILTRANRALAEDVGGERYVTVILAQIDPATRTLVYGSAGHPPGYVVSANGELRAQLRRTGIPLGIRMDTQYQAAPPLQLESGDIILLLTDGIEETMAPDDTFFGFERTLEVVQKNRQASASGLMDALYSAVREFAQGAPQLDDFTVVVIKVL